MAKFKITINDNKNLEVLLQKIYDEVDALVYQTQLEINKLSNSTDLAEEDSTIDAKTKYSKAINDLLTTKNKAISAKLDIGKLMTEILKYNGDANKALNNPMKNQSLNFEDLKKKITESMNSNNTETYQLNL